MKRAIVTVELDSYDVNVTFCGMVGSDTVYSETAASFDEAVSFAEEEARSDLDAVDICQTDSNEFEVTIQFAGLIGVEETYTVEANDEDEAIDAAIDAAFEDLSFEAVS